MTYAVKFTPPADREFRKLSPRVQNLLLPKINALAENPRPHGVEKMKGWENLYRIRAGDYRIVYEIQDNILYVYVVRVGHRRDVYKRM